jgi:hypothetical protein
MKMHSQDAFPGDSQRKSLAQKRIDGAQSAKAIKGASYDEFANECHHVANTSGTPPVNDEFHWALGPEMSMSDIIRTLVIIGADFLEVVKMPSLD